MVHSVPDCGFARAYVVEEQQGILVIDAGSRGASEKILQCVKGRLGRRADDIRLIAATHFHVDHISGISHLISFCSASAKVLFHHRVREYLERSRKISKMRNWAGGLLPAALASARYVSCPADISFGAGGIPLPVLRGLGDALFLGERNIFAGGDGLTRYGFGFDPWEIIETPGHTEDSISFYNAISGDLICGDFILNFEAGGKGKLNRFHWNGDVLMETFLRLRDEISPARIHPGHGEVIQNLPNALAGVETI